LDNNKSHSQYEIVNRQEDLISDQELNYTEGLILLLKEKSDALLAVTDEPLVEGILQLTELLFEIEPASSELMKAIDKKAQDLGTYYFIAYSVSRNVSLSLRVFRAVRFLVRYIVLMDRYYEVGNLEYKRQAEILLKTVSIECEGYMKYVTEFQLARCWPFWKFEELMKNRMLQGMSFDKKEIKHHVMFKSSDAPTIYAHIIDSELEAFNPNVALVLHYNQALQDIQDDFDDLEEDLLEKMPNIFILAATKHLSFDELARRSNEIREVAVESGAVEEILTIVLDYGEAARNINLPLAYRFLNSLTQTYVNTIIGTLTKLLEQNDYHDNRKKCYSQISAICSQ
jgi:hypothetical protein